MIDVGYAGVIGADRILDGRAPYGAMPVEDGLRACGRADADGEIRERIQSNGRCEAANPRGDTYGPVGLPRLRAGRPRRSAGAGGGTRCPAAHAAAIAFDLLALLGLVLVGRRFGGTRLAAILAFGWVAYPFTSYALVANTNDAIMPALLVWGFWFASSPAARGAAVGLAAWTKFAALVLAPLWLTYRAGLGRDAVARSRSDSPPRPCRLLDPPPRAVARGRRSARSGTGRSGSSSSGTRRSRSGAGGSTTRAGSPTSRRSRPSSRSAPSRSPGRRVRPAREGPARARGAVRRAPARVRALADPLVLPLPSLGAARSSCWRCVSPGAGRPSDAVTAGPTSRRGDRGRGRLLPHRDGGDGALAADSARRSPTSRCTRPTASGSRAASSRTATSGSSTRRARCRRSSSRRS